MTQPNIYTYIYIYIITQREKNLLDIHHWTISEINTQQNSSFTATFVSSHKPLK